MEDYTFFDKNTYQFFIVEKNGSRFLKDPLVKETVWAIIEVFFRENSNVLLYVCDTRMVGRLVVTDCLIFGFMNMKNRRNIYI